MTDTTRDTAMPAEIAKLVERLRIPWPPDGSGDEVTLPVWVFELMNEAATAITTERAAHAETKRELDEQWRRANVLAQQNAYHKDRAEAAEARVAELEKALERIEVRTRSVPSDTAEDDKRDKYHANSFARRALEGCE